MRTPVGRWRIKLSVIAGLIFNLTTLIHAASLGEAESNFSRANNEYFNQLLNKPGATVEERRQIRNRVLTPAMDELNVTMQKQREVGFSTMGPLITEPQEPVLPQGKVPLTLKEKIVLKAIYGNMDFGDAKDAPAQKEAAPLVPMAVGTRESAESTEPAIVLDGSGVKKVIEFGSGRKSGPTPAPVNVGREDKGVKKTIEFGTPSGK